MGWLLLWVGVGFLCLSCELLELCSNLEQLLWHCGIKPSDNDKTSPLLWTSSGPYLLKKPLMEEENPHNLFSSAKMCFRFCNKLITHYPWNQSNNNNNNNQLVMMSQTGFQDSKTYSLSTTKSWFHFWWTNCSSIRNLPNRANRPKIKCIQQSEKI